MHTMTNYASNLTDKEWILVEPFVKQGKMGRPREIKTREVVNAVLYVIKTGCQWRGSYLQTFLTGIPFMTTIEIRSSTERGINSMIVCETEYG